VGRLLALSDGIFAIAMTLLALDLRVPAGLGDHPSDSVLRHHLAANADSYWSFLLTFYVIGQYWLRHRRALRAVTVWHGVLARDSFALLLFVAAMPFPASLIGHYGSDPISLALYGGINAAATLALLGTRWDVRRLGLAGRAGERAGEDATLSDDNWLAGWANLVVFLASIPAGYLFGSGGYWVFLALVVPGPLIAARRRHLDRTADRTASRTADRAGRPTAARRAPARERKRDTPWRRFS
jgi:uncharacterized membrane protein